MTGKTHIVAIGARTAVGLAAEVAAAAVRASISRIAEHPTFVDATGSPLKCAVDPRLGPDMPLVERMVVMAQHTLHEAASKLAPPRSTEHRARVFVALPECRPGFSISQVEKVTAALAGMALPGIRVVDLQCLPSGHAGALQALQDADRVTRETGDIAVIVGVDSYFDIETLSWLESERRLARPGVRDGFVPGEGSGAIVLASGATCARMKLRSLARLARTGTAQEARSRHSTEGLLGEGLFAAVRNACHGLGEAHVDDLFCDINGERHRSDEWGFAVLRAAALLRDGADYRSGVTAWGDVGAASGALGCVLAVQAWARGYARGPRALVWGSSDAGSRAAVLLEDDNRARGTDHAERHD